MPFALKIRMLSLRDIVICRPRLEMCLESMADRRENKENKQMKQKWLQVHMVDYGRLFKVNDEAFSFLLSLK